VNGPNQESIELFLQEASENLQYLREYSGLLQESSTKPEDLEKLYIAAHTLAGTSGSYGFPEFSEVAAKMAHIFHYAMNAVLTPDMHGPLTEFLSDFRARIRSAADQLHWCRDFRRHRRVQAALRIRVSLPAAWRTGKRRRPSTRWIARRR
jgi:chemotaxis protein histidine kinase CheA